MIKALRCAQDKHYTAWLSCDRKFAEYFDMLVNVGVCNIRAGNLRAGKAPPFVLIDVVGLDLLRDELATHR
jgi:hypothetical protein